MSLEKARTIIDAEIKALLAIRDRLDGRFLEALALLEGCRSRVITCGMGKAGLIAQKIAATLSSTGSPAFFLHPADALHGDLGMARSGDVLLMLSNSGESLEIARLLPSLRRIGTKIISVTTSDRSTLALHSDVTILLGEIPEACPLGLVPTSTTTAMLVLGDALALCLMELRGFQPAHFAQLHPGGQLGRKALPIEDLMRRGEALAAVAPGLSVAQVILAITQARSGAAVVVDPQQRVMGIFCDGDLRRGLEAGPTFIERPVGEVMIHPCTTVRSGTLALDVLELMKTRRIAEIPVVDTSDRLLGMAEMKSLLAADP